MNPKHTQVEVDGTEVDLGISGLLRALWDFGFETQWSCEGNPISPITPDGRSDAEWPYIIFPDIEHGMEFVRVSIGLLGHCGYYEGGFHLRPMDPILEITTARASVRFSPSFLEALTLRWTSLIDEDPNQILRTPENVSAYVSSSRTLLGFEAVASGIVAAESRTAAGGWTTVNQPDKDSA